MTLGIRGRLFLVSLTLVALALGSSEWLMVQRVKRNGTERATAELVRFAAAAAETLAAAGSGADPDAIAHRLTRKTGIRVTYIAGDGLVLGDGEVAPIDLARVKNHAARPEVAQAIAGNTGSATRRSATVGIRFLYVALPAGERGGVITRVAAPLTGIEAEVARLRRSLLSAALAGLLVAAALSSLAAWLVARPLREMTAVARELAGRRFTLRARAAANDEMGTLAAALNTLSSDLERTLGDLTRERDLLGAVLNAMTDGVLVTDSGGRILRVNPALARQLGIDAGPEGGEPRSVLEALRSPALAGHVDDVLERREATSLEVEFPGPPARTYRLSSSPLPGQGGAVTVFHDVTEVRRLERIRRDFVANVSHELRTPVAALQAAGETLSAGALADPEHAPVFLAIIARNAERLGALVSDLLALARLESGQLDLNLETLAPRPLASHVLASLARGIGEKRLAAKNEIHAELRVRADARALEQILVNLLDNAVKYTPEGGSLGVSALPAAQGQVRFVVWDTGSGIEPRHRERIFERFYRVDPGRSLTLGGTGLGLSIVKHLVEALGGTAGVEGRDGGGSRFWFTLPAAE
jgi:two-component system phosphate regulon sensor histidine kinase PhoR